MYVFKMLTGIDACVLLAIHIVVTGICNKKLPYGTDVGRDNCSGQLNQRTLWMRTTAEHNVGCKHVFMYNHV